MRFNHDRRGQSVVVGTVILFGFLILAIAAYQAQFVPAENNEVEFEHSQQVEGEFLDVRNAILRAGSTGAAQSQSVQLGVRYPQRTIFLNPPPATGTLETTGTNPVDVNGTIGSGAHENVDAFWGTNPRFNTTSLRYTPSYNEYDGGPRLLYEHSVVAAEFDSALLLRSDQTVVRNDRIAVTTVTGEVSENGVEAQSLDPETISQTRNTVPITGDGGPVEIVLPTAAGNTTALRDRWRAELPDATVTEDGDTIRIELDGTETYRLGLSAVAVDGGGATEPAYIVPVGGENAVVGDSIGVEVRDKHNNPVADANVSIDGTNYRTGNDGRAFAEATAAGTVDATINGGSPPSYRSVQFDVSTAGGGGGGGGSTPPTFTSGPTTTPNTVPQGNTFDLSATVDNIGQGGTDIVNATWADDQGNSGTLTPSDGTFDQPVEAIESTGIDTTGWSTGIHTITVTATDGNANSVSEDVEVEITQSQQPPEFTSIDVSSSGTGNDNDQLTFTYSTTDDATGVTLFAETDENNPTTLVDDPAAPTDSSTGETYSFDGINMNSRDINIELTVENADGDSRTCTGTITTQGGSTSLSEMTCSIN